MSRVCSGIPSEAKISPQVKIQEFFFLSNPFSIANLFEKQIGKL